MKVLFGGKTVVLSISSSNVNKVHTQLVSKMLHFNLVVFLYVNSEISLDRKTTIFVNYNK